MVVAATGFFDGVHCGHRAVLETLRETAKQLGEESAVITFWPHPRNVLQQDAGTLRLLNTLEEKKKLINQMGIDRFYVVPFSKAFSKLDTETFLKEYLIDKYNANTLIIGYDHRLGNSSTQTPEELMAVAEKVGISTKLVNEVLCKERAVSSTKIRNLLLQGKVVPANEMLGYQYSLYGVVVLGTMIGRKLGFPTANMQLYEPLKLVPGNGVYTVKVYVNDEEYWGVCNIGNRPTIGKNNATTIETHILGFDEDIYGLDIRIKFVNRIRDEQKFESLEELKRQIGFDKDYVRQFMNKL